MNSRGITLIELVVTVAIIMTLASVAVPAYADVLGIAKDGADEASVLVLNDATVAYAMLNDIPLDEVFAGVSDDFDRMELLVDEKYLMQIVEPSRENTQFEWDAVNQKWTVSGGQESSQGNDSDDEENNYGVWGPIDDGTEDEDDGGISGDEGSGENSVDDNGNGNQNQNQNGNDNGNGNQNQNQNQNGNDDQEDELDYEIYGYGSQYDEGVKVWYNGEFYVSHKDTKKTPGHHKDWQKVTDDWFEYNSYEEGDIITYNGKQYRAKKSSCDKNPESKKSHWEQVG